MEEVLEEVFEEVLEEVLEDFWREVKEVIFMEKVVGR